MKVISFLFLIYYANLISGFLNSPEEEEEFSEYSGTMPIQDFENANAAREAATICKKVPTTATKTLLNKYRETGT